MRQNTRTSTTPYSGTTLGTLQELELDIYCGSNEIKTSAHLNTGKQMVYFPSSNSSNQYTIKVSKLTNNTEAVRYAYAWSTEDNYITLHTDNATEEITAEEVSTQLNEAGIDIVDVNNPFSVSFDETVKLIGDNALEGYENLEEVTMNYGITNIEQYAFKNCTHLKSINIPDGMYCIEQGAFQNCYALSSAVIGNSIRSIESNAFYHCFSLSSVVFRKYIAPTINSTAFVGLPNNATANIPVGAIGYADSYGNLHVIHERDMCTIYFTNNYNWNSVNAYMWKGGISYYNKDVSMEYAYTNYLNQQIFSVTFDYNEYDMMRFYDDSGEIFTVDINVGMDGTGYYLTSEETVDGWEVGTYVPDVRTIYFTNDNNWSDIRAYFWKAGTTQDNLWHGIGMSYVSTNSQGKDIYSITVDYNEFDSVVFNDYNSSEQTVDINIGDNGTAYYLSGNKMGNKWLVETSTYE